MPRERRETEAAEHSTARLEMEMGNCDLQLGGSTRPCELQSAGFGAIVLIAGETLLAFFMQGTEAMNELVGCKTCGLVQQLEHLPRGYKAECARCGETMLRGRPFSRHLTAALSLAALFLYVPANIYPVMSMHYLGRETENTVWGGVQALWRDGMWGVAMIVFAASMLVPLLKLIGLFFLVASCGTRWQKLRTRIFKIIEKIGPWAMLDVFLLAIMVAVIRFGKFGTVVPGPGILAFTAVVALTLLASSSFEPRLIWKGEDFERSTQISG